MKETIKDIRREGRMDVVMVVEMVMVVVVVVRMARKGQCG